MAVEAEGAFLEDMESDRALRRSGQGGLSVGKSPWLMWRVLCPFCWDKGRGHWREGATEIRQVGGCLGAALGLWVGLEISSNWLPWDPVNIGSF